MGMKHILVRVCIKLPNEIILKIKGKKLKIKSTKGSYIKYFNPNNLIIKKSKKNDLLFIESFNINHSSSSLLRTIGTYINNIIMGLTKGFQFKMKLVYNHFPINLMIYNDNNQSIEISNYYGQKNIISFYMPYGTSIKLNEELKNELTISGHILENIGLITSLIQNTCRINNKDTRKFIDGIYTCNKL